MRPFDLFPVDQNAETPTHADFAAETERLEASCSAQ